MTANVRAWRKVFHKQAVKGGIGCHNDKSHTVNHTDTLADPVSQNRIILRVNALSAVPHKGRIFPDPAPASSDITITGNI